MSRTRVISQSKAVYVSPTGLYAAALSGHIPDQLHRVDTFSFDVDLAGAREDVREFGQLARIGTVTMAEINPSLSFGYYLGNGENEARLGFNLQGITGAAAAPASQFMSGILTDDDLKKEKNIYVLTSKEGEDAFDAATFGTTRTNHDVVGFGNVVLTSYTANFAVGEIPRADIEAEASNIVFYTGQSSGLKNPAINDTGGRVDSGFFRLDAPSTGDMNVLVLRPDDVLVTFENDTISQGAGVKVGGTDYSDIFLQSCSVEVPLSRGTIEALGKERAVAKPLEFPIDVTVSMSAIVKNFQQGALENVLTGTAGDNNTDIRIKVLGDDSFIRHHMVLKNATLDSQNFSMGLDDNETVELAFSAQIGGSSAVNNGLFYTGAFAASADFPKVDEIGGSHLFSGAVVADSNPF